MKVLIYGSRHWDQPYVIMQYLEQLPRGTLIATGGADGADRQAETLAKHCGLDVVTFHYNSTRGKYGGPFRNKLMLDVFAPERGIGFRALGHSPGTDHMTKLLHEAGVEYEVVMQQ